VQVKPVHNATVYKVFYPEEINVFLCTQLPYLFVNGVTACPLVLLLQMGLICQPLIMITNVLRREPAQCHCVHHKSHMDCPGIELGLHSEKLASNHLR